MNGSLIPRRLKSFFYRGKMSELNKKLLKKLTKPQLEDLVVELYQENEALQKRLQKELNLPIYDVHIFDKHPSPLWKKMGL